MSHYTSVSAKIGYSRYEFGKIFQIYSQNVYSGFFKDFSFSEIEGHFFISFREEAGKTPLITIEKRKLGPDRHLFIATAPSSSGHPREIVRSEKIDIFAERLANEITHFKKYKIIIKIITGCVLKH